MSYLNEALSDLGSQDYPKMGWQAEYSDAVSILQGLLPIDAPNGNVEVFLKAIISAESGFDRTQVYAEPAPLNQKSIGLFQLSLTDNSYGCGFLSEEDIKNPIKNIQGAFLILKKLKANHPDENVWEYGGRYWSTLRWNKYSKWAGKSQKGVNEVLAYMQAHASPSAGSDEKARIKELQHKLNLLGAHLDEDGIEGPLTKAAELKYGNGTEPSHGATPWMDWVRARKGWTEFDHDKELSRYWANVGLDYKTVIGSSHAWCALLINAALKETGFKGNHNAAAVAARNIGSASELKPGCIVVFQWDSGEHHVSFCDHIVDSAHVACLGGNQSNSINITSFPRRNIIATRWPEPV